MFKAFSSEVDSGSREEARQINNHFVDRLEVADANTADVLAEHVVAGGIAAAAVAGVVDATVAGGDRGAHDGGSGEASAYITPVIDRIGFGLCGGGRKRAGHGKSSEGESSNFGLDRHG